MIATIRPVAYPTHEQERDPKAEAAPFVGDGEAPCDDGEAPCDDPPGPVVAGVPVVLGVGVLVAAADDVVVGVKVAVAGVVPPVPSG